MNKELTITPINRKRCLTLFGFMYYEHSVYENCFFNVKDSSIYEVTFV